MLVCLGGRCKRGDGGGEGLFVRENRGHEAVEAVFGGGSLGVEKETSVTDLGR